MRTIKKRSTPDKLVEWIATYKGDPEFGYDMMRRFPEVVSAVTTSLVEEQGGLCAYTGVPISAERCHIEHMLPQAYCPTGQRPAQGLEEESCRGRDVDYANMVACYPRPNRRTNVPFGAHAKGNWPPPSEESQFVKPTQNGCEDRFLFDRRGCVYTRDGDAPAAETCKRLRLFDKELTRLRKDKIDGVRNPRGKGYLSGTKLKTVLERLRSEQGKLSAYCFSTKQGIAQCISKQ